MERLDPLGPDDEPFLEVRTGADLEREQIVSNSLIHHPVVVRPNLKRLADPVFVDPALAIFELTTSPPLSLSRS